MKNKKLIKEDIESIKFMMNYDTRKTLTENREILNEIDFNETNQKIAGELYGAASGPGTNTNKITIALGQIKTAQQFYDVQGKFVAQSKRNGSTYQSIADMINYELNDISIDKNVLAVFTRIINNIPGLKATVTDAFGRNVTGKGSGQLTIDYNKAGDVQKTKNPATKTDPTKKTPDKTIGGGSNPDTAKKAVTPLPIPPQLKDSTGVKKFQDWVIGIKGDKTILGGYGSDGKFGGRTSKAWTTYGNEYLNPKLETLKPLEVTTVTPAAGTAQTIGGNTQPQPEPELQLPNNQLQQAPPTNQNMTGKQKRQFNRFSRKQERMKKRNQNQNQTQNNTIDSATPQSNTTQTGPTNYNA